MNVKLAEQVAKVDPDVETKSGGIVLDEGSKSSSVVGVIVDAEAKPTVDVVVDADIKPAVDVEVAVDANVAPEEDKKE